jgi:predicted amidohydrolase YtcJ
MDLIVINATVRTMERERPASNPLPTAVAVRGNRIAQVGQTEKLIPLASKKTRVMDARGRLLLPGFNDAHVHFLEGGFSLANVNLRPARTVEEFIELIRAHAAATPAGQWITGGEWDHENWPGAPLPRKEMIDSVTLRHPVFISRTDGHMALANSLALQRAGVGPHTQDVPGGLVVRDAVTREPTGLLKDAAMHAVSRIIPRPSAEQNLAAAKRATDYAASLGLTSVQDVLAGDDVHVYRELESRGELKTRVYAMFPIARWEEAASLFAKPEFRSNSVRVGAVKGFSDGSLGSGTAWMFEPFCDDPKNFGLPGDQMFPEGMMLKRALASDRAGLQLALHAIGDRANAEVLDLFAQVAKENGPRDRRARIEHAQHLRTTDIPRFGRDRVVASIQPYHASDDGRWCEPRLGAARVAGTYAFRSLLDSGAVLALGTDWVVAPLDPMLTLESAVHRRTLDGKHPEGWLPGQKLTVEEAVRAYTVGSAYAEFAENEKGTIEPGRLADFILLDNNIFDNSSEIGRTRVALTVADGKVAWCGDSSLG